ncbi:mucin-2, partial [Biomphalaria glabrata]
MELIPRLEVVGTKVKGKYYDNYHQNGTFDPGLASPDFFSAMGVSPNYKGPLNFDSFPQTFNPNSGFDNDSLNGSQVQLIRHKKERSKRTAMLIGFGVLLMVLAAFVVVVGFLGAELNAEKNKNVAASEMSSEALTQVLASRGFSVSSPKGADVLQISPGVSQTSQPQPSVQVVITTTARATPAPVAVLPASATPPPASPSNPTQVFQPPEVYTATTTTTTLSTTMTSPPAPSPVVIPPRLLVPTDAHASSPATPAPFTTSISTTLTPSTTVQTTLLTTPSTTITTPSTTSTTPSTTTTTPSTTTTTPSTTTTTPSTTTTTPSTTTTTPSTTTTTPPTTTTTTTPSTTTTTPSTTTSTTTPFTTTTPSTTTTLTTTTLSTTTTTASSTTTTTSTTTITPSTTTTTQSTTSTTPSTTTTTPPRTTTLLNSPFNVSSETPSTPQTNVPQTTTTQNKAVPPPVVTNPPVGDTKLKIILRPMTLTGATFIGCNYTDPNPPPVLIIFRVEPLKDPIPLVIFPRNASIVLHETLNTTIYKAAAQLTGSSKLFALQISRVKCQDLKSYTCYIPATPETPEMISEGQSVMSLPKEIQNVTALVPSKILAGQSTRMACTSIEMTNKTVSWELMPPQGTSFSPFEFPGQRHVPTQSNITSDFNCNIYG